MNTVTIILASIVIYDIVKLAVSLFLKKSNNVGKESEFMIMIKPVLLANGQYHEYYGKEYKNRNER